MAFVLPRGVVRADDAVVAVGCWHWFAVAAFVVVWRFFYPPRAELIFFTSRTCTSPLALRERTASVLYVHDTCLILPAT